MGRVQSRSIVLISPILLIVFFFASTREHLVGQTISERAALNIDKLPPGKYQGASGETLVPPTELPPTIISKTIPSTPSAIPNLGVNLARLEYWNSQIIFADAIKESDEWRDDSWLYNTVPLDQDGWPISITAPKKANALMFSGIDGHYPAGAYTLILTGQGQVKLSNDAQGTYTSPGAYSVSIPTATNAGILLSITQSVASNPLRVKLLLPGHTVQDVFYKPFLQSMQPFSAIRFMEATATNGANIKSWSERRTLTSATQTGANDRPGIAPDYLIDLALATKADPWFNIPHQADDSYLQGFAQLLKQRYIDNPLRPSGSKVWIEISNELWNGGFEQKNEAEVLARQKGLLSTTGWPGSIYWGAYMLARTMSFLEQAGISRSDIMLVGGTQCGNTGVMDAFLVVWDNPTWNPKRYQLDAFATNPYVGHTVADDIWNNGLTNIITVDQVLDMVEDTLPLLTTCVSADKVKTDEEGVKLVAYEGGQHLVAVNGAAKNSQTLTDKLNAANRKERMTPIYGQIFDIWEQEGGELFMLYHDVGQYNEHGSWGIMEYQDSPPSISPKYVAAQQAFK